MNEKIILVVTSKYASDVNSVIKELYKMDEKVIRLNTEDFPSQIDYNYKSNEEKMIFSLPHNRIVLLKDIKSILYRKEQEPKIDSAVKEESLRDFAKRESRVVLRSFYQSFNGLWINHPLRVRAASQKIYQLQKAKEVGFNIPSTLVTNQPKDLKEFYDKHKETGIIVKPLSFPIAEGQQEYYAFSTARVTEKDIGHMEEVQYSPTLFQEEVPKKYELRITVVGNKVFPCKIDSQISSKTELDWRFFEPGKPVPHEATSIPLEIEKKCVKIVKSLGLKFGAIDMIYTPDEKYVFLEINPSGMWGWIEELTGLPISKAIAQLLANH